MSNGGSIEIAGATLKYVVEGKGIPLLVLGSSIYYPRTFSKRLRESCRLLCADLPHFVPLRPEFDPARISFDFYSECIDAIRTDAGVDRVVVVGHSHHGNLALEYARRNPAAVSHLVLIGTPPADIATTIQVAEQYWGMRCVNAAFLHANWSASQAVSIRRLRISARKNTAPTRRPSSGRAAIARILCSR